MTVDSATVDKLRFELAQLDLIAHRPARDAARALLAHHLQFYYRLIHPHEPLIDRTAPLNDYLAFSTELHRLEEDSLAEPALTWVCPR